MKKKGIEFNFSWIFAIIVGAVVIFLAVYGTTKLVGTERTVRDTEVGKELGVILIPVETSVESGRRGKITLPSETRLFNECDSRGAFGEQKISIAIKSRIGEEWDRPGVPSSFKNKYIFSSNIVEGEEYRIFSKPLEMPYKVADLIFMWSENDKYCLVNPPREIEEEIDNSRLEGINVVTRESECINGEVINFELSSGNAVGIQGRVKKGFDEVYFVNPELAFGAVFADRDIYECQVKRLMKRASELALVYKSKGSFLSPKGCRSNLDIDLERYANSTFSVEESFDLISIQEDAKNLRRRNDDLSCKLF